jgi:hypothetical protein
MRRQYVLDNPRFRTVRPDAKKQPVPVTKQTVFARLIGLGFFTGLGGQHAHGV